MGQAQSTSMTENIKKKKARKLKQRIESEVPYDAVQWPGFAVGSKQIFGDRVLNAVEGFRQTSPPRLGAVSRA